MQLYYIHRICNITAFEFNSSEWKKLRLKIRRQSSSQDNLCSDKGHYPGQRERDFFARTAFQAEARAHCYEKLSPQNRSNDITENLSLSPLTGAAPERGSAATVYTTGQIVRDSVGIAERFTESARFMPPFYGPPIANDREKIGVKIPARRPLKFPSWNLG